MSTRLGFVVRTGERGPCLVLPETELFGWLSVRALELAVPGETGMAAAAPEAYQRRRTVITRAALGMSQDAIHEFAAASLARLARHGVEALTLRCADEHVSVVARVREGRTIADLTCRLYLLGLGQTLRVLIGEPQVYGYLPTPAHVAAHRVIAALLRAGTPEQSTMSGGMGQGAAAASPAASVSAPVASVVGLGQFELAPLAALLWHTLPPMGWRLPATTRVSLTSMRITPAAVELDFQPLADSDQDLDPDLQTTPALGSADALALAESYALLTEADRALLDGDIDTALRAYRGELATSGPDQPVVVERIMAISTADPSSFMEVTELARNALARWPGYTSAHSCLANVASAQGNVRQAAFHFQQLAELTGDDDAAACAALAGARLLRSQDDHEGATELYELLHERIPGHPEAAAALAEVYSDSGRWRELAAVQRAAIAQIGDAADRSRQHVQLAVFLRDQAGDAAAARAELERACELDPGNEAAFEALAELAIADGRLQDAMDALDHVARLWFERGDTAAQARTYLGAAVLCEQTGNTALAEDLYQSALELDGTHPTALRGAASAAMRRDDYREATRLWQTLLAHEALNADERLAVRLELGRSLAAAGDVAGAEQALYELLEHASGDIAAEVHRVLATAYRAASDPEGATAALDRGVASLVRVAEALFAQAGPGAGDSLPGGPDSPDSPDSEDSDEAALRERYAESKRYLSRAAQLALERAMLLDELGQHEPARVDYQRAHSLARDADPGRAREAARALLRAEERRGDRRGQRRWIDALLATHPAAGERNELLMARADLRARDPQDTDGALRDIQDVLSADEVDGDTRALALSLQAKLLAALGDRGGQARSLAERASLVDSPLERARAEVESAEAWLEANDLDSSLFAARRAMDELVQAEAAGLPVEPQARTRICALLGEIGWRRRAWTDVIRGYQPLIDISTHTATGLEQIRYAYRLGMALDAVGDHAAAVAALERVLTSEDAPPDVRTSTWRTLAQVQERAGNLIEAAESYEALAADPRAKAGLDSRAEAFYRASELYRRQRNREADAERCLEAALSLVSDHLPALDALEQLKWEQGDYERVASLLSRKIALCAHSPEQQRLLFGRLATLQYEHLERPDLARASYARALELDPEFRPALRFMAPDELMSGNLERAAEIYARLARELPGDAALAAVPPAPGASAGEGTGNALLDQRVAAAEALAEIALKLPPDSELRVRLTAQARAVCTELLERLPGQRGLLAHLGALDGTPQPPAPAPVATTGGAASVAPEASAELLAELRERADQAAERGAHSVYIEHLNALIAATPEGSKPRQRARRAELYLELASAYFDHLANRPAGRQAMRAAADAFGPGSRRDATLRMLAAEAAADGTDEEAVAAYEAISPGRRGAADRVNLAAAYQRLGRDYRALAVLEEARAAELLTNEGARRLLVLKQEMARSAEAARELEDSAASSTSPERAASALTEALELYEQSLGDQESASRVRAALEALRGASAASASASSTASASVSGTASASAQDARAALAELRRSVAQSNRHDVLVRGLLAAAAAETDAQAASTLWREAAYILRDRLGDHRQSADALLRALEATPGNPGLFSETDTALRRLGDLHQLMHAYELHAGALNGPSKAAPLYKLGLISRDIFNDEQRAGEYFSRAYQADPERAEVWLPLANYLASRGDAIRARALYQQALERGSYDADTRAWVMQRLSSLPAEPARARARAATNPPVSAEPARARARAATNPPLSAAPATAVPVADSRDIEVMLRQGAELEQQSQLEAAQRLYTAVATLNPHDRRPLIALERVYRKRGDLESMEALVNLLGRHVELVTDARERAQLWYRRAKLYRDSLRLEAETYRCLREAHACDPDDGEITYALRTLSMARGEWALAAELVLREIGAATDDREAGALHLELALIYDEKLLDAARARAHYERALALDSNIPAAPRPLARLYELTGRHADAARMYEQAAKHVRDAGERSRLLQRAAASAELAKDTDSARRLYQLAVVAAVSDKEARSMAQSALARLAGTSERGDALEQTLDRAADDRQRRALLKELLERATTADDSDAAVRHASSLIGLDAGDLSAYLVLKARAEATGDWGALAKLLEARATALQEPVERAAAYYDLGRLQQIQLGNPAAAVVAYERALAADPNHPHPPALEALAELTFESRDWKRAQELHEQLQPGISTLSADTIAYRRGVIAENLNEDTEALDAYEQAVALAPDSRQALSGLMRVAMRTGELSRAIIAARALLELLPSDDTEALTTARLQLSELCGRAGDHAQAIQYAEQCLAENPRSQPALRMLSKLYLEHNDLQGAVRTLRALIGVTAALPQRAELLYRLGELYRTRLDNSDEAADAYLKAIDLDPAHVPTLRRLVDYYWRQDDPEELMAMVGGLVEQAALLHERTTGETLARAMIAAAVTGDIELARQIARYLAEKASRHLVPVLLQVISKPQRNLTATALADALTTIASEVPTLSVPQVANAMAVAGASWAQPLVQALRSRK